MQLGKFIQFTSITIHPDDPRYPYAVERAKRDEELREYLKRHSAAFRAQFSKLRPSK